MLPDVDLRLLGKQLAEDGTRIHRRVDLLAIGHQGERRSEHFVPRLRRGAVNLATMRASGPMPKFARTAAPPYRAERGRRCNDDACSGGDMAGLPGSTRVGPWVKGSPWASFRP